MEEQTIWRVLISEMGSWTVMRVCRLALKYDGKRPASLDDFLHLLGISELEFENILLNNAVIDWGFCHENIQKGEPLPDMDQWDTLI